MNKRVNPPEDAFTGFLISSLLALAIGTLLLWSMNRQCTDAIFLNH